MSDDEYSGRKYGYARVSTEEQDTQLQIDALLREGVPEELIFQEKMSGATMERPRLKALLASIRPGDTVVVWRLDRLGRSLIGIMDAVEKMQEKGIRLHSCTEGLDPSTASGRFALGILALMAQYERELTSERTRAGMDASPNKSGRPHSVLTYPKRVDKLNELIIEGLWPNGELRGKDVVRMLNEADPDAPPIAGPAMLTNWKNKGFPGLELPPDEPLDDV